MTRTAELAHIVLPTTTCFEKTQFNLGAHYNPANLQNQVIDWIGDSWPDWKITFELAKRMGLEKEFPVPQGLYDLHWVREFISQEGINVNFLEDHRAKKKRAKGDN